MAVVKELIRTEENGAISFGDYELAQKSKLSDYQHQGDMYKVKTFKEITKLERNQFREQQCLTLHRVKRRWTSM